jgi:hypothetical protein
MLMPPERQDRALDAAIAAIEVLTPPENTMLWEAWASIMDELTTYRELARQPEMLDPLPAPPPVAVNNVIPLR